MAATRIATRNLSTRALGSRARSNCSLGGLFARYDAAANLAWTRSVRGQQVLGGLPAPFSVTLQHIRTATTAFTGAKTGEIMKNIKPKLLIHGKFVDAASGKTFPTLDPRNENVLMEIAEGGKEDVDRAVEAAHKAFYEGPWPKMTAKERGRIMYKFADLLEQNLEEMAQLESLDNGKPLKVARAADVPLSVDCFRYYAGWADKVTGKTIRADGSYFCYTLHEPIGVVGAIVPWNFSLLMAAWKLAPSLCLGNTVVLKPAEQTPLTALRMGELALEAGIPPGVLNIVTGDGPVTGAALSTHPKVDKVAFTGSTEVGKKIMAAAAQGVKPVTLELGGKSPVIVGRDMDPQQAVELTHMALFFNHGQCCAAGSRLYVHEDVYDEFVAASVERARARVVGDPFEESTEQGPQVDKDQLNKILGYIEKGKSEGATLCCGGNRVGDKGYFVEPTVFSNVTDDMAIAREEIFGPVQPIMKYSSMDEVLRRANDNPYGLAAGVMSNDIDIVNTLTRGLRAGTVWVNCYNVYDIGVPFGGYKESGIGRDKGEYALENYSQVKAVYQAMKKPVWL